VPQPAQKGREAELRRSLVEAHDHLLAREAEIEQLRSDLEITRSDLRRRLELVQGDLANERALRQGDLAWNGELSNAMEEQVREVRLLRAELERRRRRSLRGIAGRVNAVVTRSRG
jgi:hypothetical protein